MAWILVTLLWLLGIYPFYLATISGIKELGGKIKFYNEKVYFLASLFWPFFTLWVLIFRR